MKKVVGVLLVLITVCTSTAMATELGTKQNSNIIKLKDGYAVISDKNEVEIVFHGEKYKMVVNKLGTEYVAKIVDSKGNTLWREKMEYNPIALLEKGKIGTKSLPIPPDANINIYPDRYTYHKGEKGRVTIDVENGGVSIGFTSYFILIPEGVDYNGILDGPEPTGEVQLTDENLLDCTRVRICLWKGHTACLAGCTFIRIQKVGCTECYIQQCRKL